MKKFIYTLIMLAAVSLQANAWIGTTPEDGGQYYIYSKTQQKFLLDNNQGWSEDGILWTFTGTTDSYSLKSENDYQFAMYRTGSFLNYKYNVATNATDKSGSDITLKSDGSASGYSIYRESKSDNWSGNRNLASVEDGLGLSIVADASSEFQFVTAQEIDNYKNSFSWIAPESFTAFNIYEDLVETSHPDNIIYSESSNPEVAEFIDGKLYTYAAGTADFTISIEGGKQENVTVTVTEPAAHAWTCEAPAAGDFILYNPGANVYLQAVNTVTSDITKATVFTLSGSSKATISYVDNGTTNYVYDKDGNAGWGTSSLEWDFSSDNGGYTISYSSWFTTRYITVTGNSSMSYPKSKSDNYTWVLISADQAHAYIALESAKAQMTAENRNAIIEANAAEDYASRAENLANIEGIISPRASLSLNATAQYGTLYLPFDIVLPLGVSAYTVGNIEADGTINLTEAGNEVDAYIPYIIQGSFAVDNTAWGIVKENNTVVNSALVGTISPTTVSSGYVLQLQETGVGFFKVENDITLPANRCYLDYEAPSADVKALSFNGSADATALSAIQALTTGQATIYDINGRQLSHLQKGINIINGKKVLVK